MWDFIWNQIYILSFIVALTGELVHNNVNNSLKVSKKNCRLSTAWRAYVSRNDRSNSQPSLLDTHRMSKTDMLVNSIFFELILYPRKLVFYTTGITKSCNSSTMLSHFEACDTDGVSILRKAWERDEGMLTSFSSRQKQKDNIFFSPSEKISLSIRYFTDTVFLTNVKFYIFF